MNRSVPALLLLALAVSGPRSARAETIEPFPVGKERQLFIDRAFFAQAHEVRLRLHQPRKTGEKNLQADRPWESATLNWFTLLADRGVVDRDARYRIWYECYDVPGWPTEDDTSFCYAESRDGIHWTKPELGLFEYQGSRKNNILFRQIGAQTHRSRVHGTGVFLDPTGGPGTRYKAVSQGQWRGRNPPHRIAGMVSPDGLGWRRLAEPICDVPADSQYGGFWDESRKRYVILGRTGTGVGRSESADFSRFEPLRPALLADRGDPPNTVLYNAAVIKHPGAANVYLMFPSLYRRDPAQDTLDIRLAVSRDGLRWNYPEQDRPFIPLGPAGAWDSKTLYMGQGMIEVGEETWLYYSGSPLRHNEAELDNLVRCPHPRAFSRVVLRRDRFVSVDADRKGWFVTPPLRFEGRKLKLNVQTRPGGEVRVGVLSPEGTPLAGLGAMACQPIAGDHLDTPVQWSGKSSLPDCPEGGLRLRFELRQASLFGFQFE